MFKIVHTYYILKKSSNKPQVSLNEPISSILLANFFSTNIGIFCVVIFLDSMQWEKSFVYLVENKNISIFDWREAADTHGCKNEDASFIADLKRWQNCKDT